jgi:hypothetical protein
MSSFRIRPSFEMTSSKPPEEIIALVKEKLKTNSFNLSGIAMQDHITIQIKKSHRHYWSPQCALLLNQVDDTKTIIRGLYGPMPNVWTLFIISYLAIGVVSTFISIIGLSQWMFDQEAKILWALPVLIIVAIALYLMSQMGQKLGASQTYAIHYFLQETLHEEMPQI